MNVEPGGIAEKSTAGRNTCPYFVNKFPDTWIKPSGICNTGFGYHTLQLCNVVQQELDNVCSCWYACSTVS